MKNFEFLSPKDGFLGLHPEDAPVRPEDAEVVIVPFGLEASVSYSGGTSKGPQAMIEASKQVELFDEELWCESFRRMSIATMKEFPVKKKLEEAVEQLEAITQTLLDAGKFPMIFGGEHSITAGSIRPFARKYKDLAILHFDAHADLRDGYDGEHYSHASALRRCLDNPELSLVSVGIRNISAEEIPFLEANRHRVEIFWGKDRKSWDVQKIVSSLKGRPIYVTFDVDGFDASLMPATGTPEPGGIFWEEAVEIIRAASEVGTIVGADINELAPIEGLHYCDFLAAKLAYKILGYTYAAKAEKQAKAA